MDERPHFIKPKTRSFYVNFEDDIKVGLTSYVYWDTLSIMGLSNGLV